MTADAHRFLADFTPEARARLLRCIIRETYADGAYLFQAGDKSDGVYLVLEGLVEVIRTAGAQEKILDLVQPGDYFGEIAVLDGLGRSTAARARGTTLIAKVPGPDLLEILGASPGHLTLKLLQHVVSDFRRVTDQVVREIVYKEKLSLVGEMASSLMHDLRSPVANIRLSADLIDETSPTGKIPAWCDGIRLQCDRVVGMTSELMEFSQGEAKLAPAPISTTTFLDQFKSLHEECAAPAGIEMRFEAEPAEIEIDSIRMQRVLQNLVANAIEALEETPQPRIAIKVWRKDGTGYLSVTDNGPGIPSAIRNRIFEPFVTYGKKRGVGLGMAIVHNIVTDHGGTITFETAPGQGASFLVSLPQKSAAQR
jgi:signal transduction histidine kinase